MKGNREGSTGNLVVLAFSAIIAISTFAAYKHNELLAGIIIGGMALGVLILMFFPPRYFR